MLRGHLATLFKQPSRRDLLEVAKGLIESFQVSFAPEDLVPALDGQIWMWNNKAHFDQLFLQRLFGWSQTKASIHLQEASFHFTDKSEKFRDGSETARVQLAPFQNHRPVLYDFHLWLETLRRADKENKQTAKQYIKSLQAGLEESSNQSREVRVSIKIPLSVLGRIDDQAERRRLSREEWLRHAIERGLRQK